MNKKLISSGILLLILLAGVPVKAFTGGFSPSPCTMLDFSWQQGVTYGACETDPPSNLVYSILSAALDPLNEKGANLSFDGLQAAYGDCSCTFKWQGNNSFRVTLVTGGGGDLVVLIDPAL